MTAMRELDLSFNQIYQLPLGLPALSSVTALRLSFNELKMHHLVRERE